MARYGDMEVTVMRKKFLEIGTGTSLVVQGLSVCLAMQGTQVRSLTWDDPTCCRVAESVCHSY